jgi:hypothetical protein
MKYEWSASVIIAKQDSLGKNLGVIVKALSNMEVPSTAEWSFQMLDLAYLKLTATWEILL